MQKENNNKVTTIEGLAGMLQGEFLRIHDRFDGMDSEFSKIHKELKILRTEVEAIKKKLEDLELRLSQMAPNFEIKELKERLKAVEEKLGISS